jgi:hypothetical protein
MTSVISSVMPKPQPKTTSNMDSTMHDETLHDSSLPTHPSTKQLQEQAILAARDKEWMVLSAGDDYKAIVIAYPRNRETNWYREMIIVDGQAETKTVRVPTNVWDDVQIKVKLNNFKLTQQVQDHHLTKS